jgi:hypothetical protein
MQLSKRQACMIYDYTLLPIWQPEQEPVPTIAEASALIDLLIRWSQNQGSQELRGEIVATVRRWFPSWDGKSLQYRPWRRFKKFGAKQPGTEPEATPETPAAITEGEPVTMEIPAAEPKAKRTRKEKTPEPAAETPAEPASQEPEQPATRPEPVLPDDDTAATIAQRIRAGIKNLYLVGPAGCGKTTLCKQVASALELPCTILSCNAGTSPAEIKGRLFPHPEACPVSLAIQQPGIVVLDELPAADPAVVMVANSLLANGEIMSTVGLVVRHPDCVVIATANTCGTGADRMYIGNNQLDAATLDRFVGGFIHVDYSQKYEESVGHRAACAFVWKLRETIARNNWRRIASTRMIITATQMIQSDIALWKEACIASWSKDEQAQVLS